MDQARSGRRDSLIGDRLRPALDYIHRHYSEPIQLAELAERLGLSYSRTYHLFKEATGLTFKAYMNRVRVEEAKLLLVRTDLTVGAICAACGYRSHPPFFQAFRKLVGMTPQQYRDAARATDGGPDGGQAGRA